MELHRRIFSTQIMGKKANRLANRAKFNKNEAASTLPPEKPKTVPVVQATAASVPKVVAKAVPSPKKESVKAEDANCGYIVEIASDNGKTLYWKVLTQHPETKEYVTALAYKPGITANIGAKISLTLVPHFDKWSATNVAVVSEVSEISPYVEQIAEINNEVPETNSAAALFPSQVAAQLLQKTQKTGKLAQDLGFKHVVGRVMGGSKIQFA